MSSSLHPLWLVIFTTVIALIPLLVGVTTSYIKVSIVLGMVRSALGAQQMPSALVVMALSLALTLYIIAPVLTKTGEIAAKIDFETVLTKPTIAGLKTLAPLLEPWHKFMDQHAGHRERTLLQTLAEPGEDQKSSSGTPWQILIPAFVLTELKEAFAMGFVLLLPFLAVDLIVANIMVGLGMFMVSPVIVALPIKLILFVVSDGWLLLAKGLVHSYV